MYVFITPEIPGLLEKNGAYSVFQKQINALARYMLNVKREDRISEGTLMGMSCLKNVNALVISQLLNYAWKMHKEDGHHNNMNILRNTNRTRSGSKNKWTYKYTKRSDKHTFLVNLVKLWNNYGEIIVSEKTRNVKIFIKKLSEKIAMEMYN